MAFRNLRLGKDHVLRHAQQRDARVAEFKVDELADDFAALDGLDLVLRGLGHLADAAAEFRDAELEAVEADGLDADAERFRELLIREERLLFHLLHEELLPLLLLDPCHLCHLALLRTFKTCFYNLLHIIAALFSKCNRKFLIRTRGRKRRADSPAVQGTPTTASRSPSLNEGGCFARISAAARGSR